MQSATRDSCLWLRGSQFEVPSVAWHLFCRKEECSKVAWRSVPESANGHLACGSLGSCLRMKLKHREATRVCVETSSADEKKRRSACVCAYHRVLQGAAQRGGRNLLQKPLRPGNTKKIRKSHEIPHPGSGPENTKKIQKKYENGHFQAIFVFFLYFFRIFGARPGVGDFVTFSYFFRISGPEGFLSSIPGTRNRKIKPLFSDTGFGALKLRIAGLRRFARIAQMLWKSGFSAVRIDSRESPRFALRIAGPSTFCYKEFAAKFPLKTSIW